MLPDDARNSFKSTSANVTYMMKCTADVPWGIDGEGTLEIFVTNIKDLNEDIETLEDAEGQDESKVGWGCLAQGPISVNVKIQKSGFVCGEKVQINVKVMIYSHMSPKQVSIDICLYNCADTRIFSAFIWWKKRNAFPGLWFKSILIIPKNICYILEPIFQW